jgi:hypothetical protein
MSGRMKARVRRTANTLPNPRMLARPLRDRQPLGGPEETAAGKPGVPGTSALDTKYNQTYCLREGRLTETLIS